MRSRYRRSEDLPSRVVVSAIKDTGARADRSIFLGCVAVSALTRKVTNTLFTANPTREPYKLVFIGNPDSTIRKIAATILTIIAATTATSTPFYCL